MTYKKLIRLKHSIYSIILSLPLKMFLNFKEYIISLEIFIGVAVNQHSAVFKKIVMDKFFLLGNSEYLDSIIWFFHEEPHHVCCYICVR